LNVLDWIGLAVVTFSVLFGILKGIIREIFSLAGFVIGFILASKCAGPIADRLSGGERGPIWFVVAFAVVLIAVIVLFELAGFFLSKLAQVLQLSVPDRLMGGVFGLVRGGLLYATVLVCAVLLLPDTEPVLRRSPSARFLLPFTAELTTILPSRYEEVFRERYDALEDRAPAPGRSGDGRAPETAPESTDDRAPSTVPR
jgi:membrane protein required for colicin V production